MRDGASSGPTWSWPSSGGAWRPIPWWPSRSPSSSASATCSAAPPACAAAPSPTSPACRGALCCTSHGRCDRRHFHGPRNRLGCTQAQSKLEVRMPRFIAVVKLTPAAMEDLAGPRKRFDKVRDYLARRGIRLDQTFPLDGPHHLLVLESPESPTRLLNRALAQAWPAPTERPGHAKLISAADPVIPERPRRLSPRFARDGRIGVAR